MGLIDVGVLVDDGVARVVPQELDRHIQLLFAAHAVAGGGHLRASSDGVGPGEAGDGGLHRIFQHRQTFDSDGVG